MIKRILLATVVSFLLVPAVLAQFNNQKALSRRTENVVFKDGRRIVKAYRYETVVYDDQGREVIILHAHKGKIRERKDLKPGEYWTQHDGNEAHRVAVEVKDVDDSIAEMALSAPTRWAANATVCISITAGFNDEQKEAIYLAAEAWNQAGVATFKRAGPSCGAYVTVERYPVLAERKGRAAAATLQESRDGVLVSARILIDSTTQRSEALRSLIAHELGHSLGLPDCKGCKSVMRPFTDANKSNGYFGPSVVDLAALAAAAR